MRERLESVRDNFGGRMRKRVLVTQTGIIAFCLIAVAELITQFPFPSPLIKPFLPPKLRWPPAEVAAWVEAQNYDPGFLEFFYRDPERIVPLGQNLVSPADGVLRDVVVKDGVSYFIVALSFWDVHVVRTPVAGVVKNITSEGYTLFRNSSEVKDQVYLKGKAGPVQQVLTLDTDYGEVRVRLITSYWASRLKVWVHEGDRLTKGQRIGRILLGSSVVAEFLGKATFAVQSQQRVVGGETIIFNGGHFQ